MATTRFFSCICCGLLGASPLVIANAQTPTVGSAATGFTSGAGQSARDSFVVSPDGRITKVTRPPALRLQIDVLQTDEGVADVLGRHGLADDAKTREMLRILNPGQDFSTGKLPRGTRIDLFSATGGQSQKSIALKYTFDQPNVGRMVFRTQALETAQIKKTALELPPNSFPDAELAKVYERSLRSIQTAAETLEARADVLPRRDYAVAQYRIEYANKRAAALNTRARFRPLTEPEINGVAVAARSTASMGQRVLFYQQAATWRTVAVNVFKTGTIDHAGPLQVYVVPSGALEMPWLWTQAQLESFLNDFSFTKDASPASQEVADFDARICVGPKNAVAAMAKLIANKKLTTCRRAPDFVAGGGPLVLSFRFPDDVAQP